MKTLSVHGVAPGKTGGASEHNDFLFEHYIICDVSLHIFISLCFNLIPSPHTSLLLVDEVAGGYSMHIWI